jgi:hypothetical protein
MTIIYLCILVSIFAWLRRAIWPVPMISKRKLLMIISLLEHFLGMLSGLSVARHRVLSNFNRGVDYESESMTGPVISVLQS